jgi:radical SAM protein with 4Fe4S-binding SPASM domain
MTAVAGNVRRQSFGEIWRSSPVLQQLRDVQQLKGRCGACEFKELCGGCRCRAYAAYGDYLQEDPACTYQPAGQPLTVREVAWSSEARARLERIPLAFVREKVKDGLETYARRKGLERITPEVMKEGMAGMERPQVFKGMPSFGKESDGENEK